MNAIRIRTTLTSDTLHLPELQPLVGRPVEIIVLDESGAPAVRPGTGDWEEFVRLAREVKDYDFDAWREQREFDRQHAADHQP